MSEKFGKLLRKLRLEKGLTMKQLLDQLPPEWQSYSESEVSKWENGKRMPPEGLVEALEDLFSTPPGDLLDAANYTTTAAYRRLVARPEYFIEAPLDNIARMHGPAAVRICYDNNTRQFYALVQEDGNKRRVPVIYDSDRKVWKWLPQE